MGHPQVWIANAVWDTIAYFAALNPVFLNGRLADCDFMDSIRPTWDRFQGLNHRMQAFFREWDERQPARDRPFFVDMASDVFYELNEALCHPCDGEDLREWVRDNVSFLEDIARVTMAGAARLVGVSLAPEEIDPHSFSLLSLNGNGREEADGTSPESLARAEQAVSHIWLDAPVESPAT